MNRLFLAFSNSQKKPLPTLQEEDDQVYTLLARREKDKHFSLYRDSFTTIPKVAHYLQEYQKEIALFLFSGHAGKHKLLLDDTKANAAGIAQSLILLCHFKRITK